MYPTLLRYHCLAVLAGLVLLAAVLLALCIPSWPNELARLSVAAGIAVCSVTVLFYASAIYQAMGAQRVLHESECKLQRVAEARASAEQANSSKSEFLANMSHEIRTPLTAILGFAEALLEPDLDPSERLAAIHTIRANGEYLLGIMNDILDISKIEAGKMTVERISCEPRRVISEIEPLLLPRATAKGLDFEIEFRPGLPQRINTDPTRLQQIAVNLLSNAVKFTARGRIRLIVGPAYDAEGKSVLQLDVMDSGIGIAADHAASLFVPFTQADASTTRHFGGSGLGLSISRRIARMLDGDVELVASRIGHGSHFRATVGCGTVGPMEEPSGESRLVSELTPMPDSDEPALLPDCRILLAEDGADNRRLLIHILTRAGASVTSVDNGQKAIDEACAAKAAGMEFDCVVMDMQMPVVDGYAACRALRANGYRGAIIALTAHAMLGDRQRCLDAGCDDYATKPINRRSLLQLVAKYCHASGIDAEPRLCSTAR